MEADQVHASEPAGARANIATPLTSDSTDSKPNPAAGWFALQRPADLLRKLKHDLARIEADTADSFAAFDFFVTAWHLLDWVHPGDEYKGVRRRTVEEHRILAVCSHLANGVKHFQLRAHHDSVASTEEQGPFDRTFDNTFERVHLVLQLDGDAADVFGKTVDVVVFARKVLGWWVERLGKEASA